MKTNQTDLKLLPGIFKKIAFGLMILSVIFLILNITKTLSFEKEAVKTITKSGFLVSLLLLAVTKNKIEDERTLKIRLKAFTASLIYGVILVVVDPIINFIFEDNFLSDKGAIDILITMFIFYFILVFLMKRKQ